ncbi:hypothetical protein [Tautonia sociabilis]|uniref:Uncharacterized protein n=1 Tax=Tautonia sociabilis TaxID=2080755 RepID=A0A432MD73_9BACT|nr:hypothetical protein [Tautonia sociabilis]RUL81429.1 hypothetical protein TsocGM_25030 [Tautonia sociabilis]
MSERQSPSRSSRLVSLFLAAGSACMVIAVIGSIPPSLNNSDLAGVFGADKNLQDHPEAARTCPQTTLEAFQRIGDPIADGVTAACTQADTELEPPRKCWECEHQGNGLRDREIAFTKVPQDPGILPWPRNCGQLKQGRCAMVDPDGDGIFSPGCDDAQFVDDYYCSIVTDRAYQN